MSESVVLVVDPDADARSSVRETLADVLSGVGARIETAGTLAAASDVVDGEGRLECVVTEHDLPDGTGAEILDHVRTVRPDAACILFTDASPEAVASVVDGTVTEYLGKETPHALDRLGDLVYTMLTMQPQTSYPVPQDEAERRAALRQYDLDDTGLRASLERVTDLAADHFDAPLASVNIIEEHEQEFLVCHGVESPWEPVDRESAVCTFTIVEDAGVMAVEDLHEDPRFENDEDLLSLGFRAYVGATMTTASGLPIGTLCVYDHDPRVFTEAEQAYLADLAAVAMDLIDAYNRAADVPDPGAESEGKR